jgi:hypothetical protein
MAQSDIDRLDLLADPDQPRDLIGFVVHIGDVADTEFARLRHDGFSEPDKTNIAVYA